MSTISQKQCDQIGLISKWFGNKFSHKCNTNFWWLLGLIWKMTCKVKTALGTFRQCVEKIGLLFVQTSLHTGDKCQFFHGSHLRPLVIYLRYFHCKLLWMYFTNYVFPDFLNFLATFFIKKVAQILRGFMGFFDKQHL